MSKCKICESSLNERINKEINSGSELGEVIKFAANRGLKITDRQLKNHLRHIKTEEGIISNVEVMDTTFESFCSEVGLCPQDFKNLDENVDKIIFASQKAISLLVFKNLALATSKMDECLLDEALYPTDTIRGLKLVFEMFKDVNSIQSRVDINTAIRTLESRGYQIKGGEE